MDEPAAASAGSSGTGVIASHPWALTAAPIRWRANWDRLGVWASIACAIHCLAAPLLFLAVPAVASVWAHPASHTLVAMLVLPLAATVLLRGYRTHRVSWVAAAAAAGSGAILVGCFLPFLGSDATAAGAVEGCAECCPRIVEDGSVGWPPASVATLIGSGFLIAPHLGNLACCRGCRSSRPSP